MGPPSAPKPSIFLFSRSSNQPALLEPIARGLGAARDIDYRLLSRAADLGAAVIGSDRVVLLANCLMKEDIADLYNVLPQFAPRVEEGTLRILVLNSIGHPRLGSLLRSRAAVEILELPTTLKAVQYKLKASLAGVHQAYQKAAALRAKTEPVLESDPTLGTKTRAARAKPKSSGQDVVWQSPVEFRFDHWWILGRKSIRNVVGVWLIDLLGPGPAIGVWEEIPGVERAEEKAWTWRPRATAEATFQIPAGRWIFFGKQPEFSWQKNLWSFVSKQPMLAFYPDGSNAPEYVRIEYRPDEGLLCQENSAFTKTLLQKIEATFESRLGGRADLPEETEVEGDFGSWDFPTEPAAPAPTSIAPAADEGGVDWKDHTGAEGVEIRGKDVRVPTKARGPRPMRNALTPDEASAAGLGFATVGNPGVVAGSEAFERLEIHVEALRKNGALLDRPPEILLYEVTEAGSILFLRDHLGRLGDQFVLRYHLDSGGQKMWCAMDWELTSIDLELADGMLVTGTFRSGDFDPLFILLDRIDARKRELKDFYSAARG